MRLILLFALGCASAPKWVEQNTIGEAGFLFNVGEASGIKNEKLARSTANNRARAEVSKSWEVFLATVARTYTESDPEKGVWGCGIRTVSDEFLNEVEIVEEWTHPDGRLFSRARLDLRDVAGYLTRYYRLAPEAQARMEKAVDAAYAEVAGVPPGTYARIVAESHPVHLLASNGEGCR